MFRLCDDEGLVSAVTTPDKPPSLADLEALEQCFQRGLLRCDDVDGNDCSQVEVCGEYAADWGACADPGKYLHCRDEQKTEGKYWACVNTQETCDHGKMARYKLRIPESFPASQHTILSYRWDTYENNEVFVGCADVAITTDGDAAPVTPKPTPRPTTKDEVEWDCSEYSQSCHRLDHNNGDAFKALGTTTSWGTESVCANKGEQARWTTHWCPKQDLTCTKAKSCRRLDGKTGMMSTSSWNEAKCLEQGATARWTTMWCPDDEAPATPRPTSKPTAAGEDDDADAYCCQNDGKSCDGCSWIAPPGNYCAQSEENCGNCGEQFAWCIDGAVTDDETRTATGARPAARTPTPARGATFRRRTASSARPSGAPTSDRPLHVLPPPRASFPLFL